MTSEMPWRKARRIRKPRINESLGEAPAGP